MTTQITPGTHTARAIRWAWDTTQSGAMCLAIMFELTDGEHAGAQIDGRLYFDTDRPDTRGRTAADRSLEALRALGLKGDLDTIDEGVGGLDGGSASLVIENNAKGFPAVKYINVPHGAGRELRTFQPPAQDAKRAFFAQMKARTRAAEQGARASGTAPRSPAAPQRNAPPPRPTGFATQESADDDVPF